MHLNILQRTYQILLIGILANVCLSCKYQVALSPPWEKGKSAQKQEIRFVKAELLDQIAHAKAAGKPVFLDFYTDWCGPCRVMDRDIFTDGDLANYFNEKFLNLKVNAEKGDGIALVKQFGVSGYPTLLFLDGGGVEQKRLVGITTAKNLIKVGKTIQ
jgi:thiol:disulfide interchange protein